MRSDGRLEPLTEPVTQSRADDTSRGRAALMLALITLLGAALRLATLNTRSFWLDETTSVRQALWPYAVLIDEMSQNVHPPLFHFLLHNWIIAFGKSEIAVRSFAVTLGLIAMPLMYWAGVALYNRRVGLIATGIIAFSPFFVWYAQEARMYTLMLVFAILSTGSMWRALETNRLRWWALYAFATAAGTMTQYFFAFLVAGQGAYLFFYVLPHGESIAARAGQRRFTWRRPWRIFRDVPQLGGWLVAMFFAALPSAWWLPKVFERSTSYALKGFTQPINYGWSPPGFGLHFNELISVPVEWAFGFHSTLVMRDLVAMWPLLITLAFLSIGYAERISPKTWYLVAGGIGGSVAIVLISLWQPILEARYFTAVTVPLVILSARFLSSMKRGAFRVAVALMLLIALVGWTDQSFNPDNIIKWDNRQAMAIVSNGFKPGDVILLIPFFVSSIPEYYLPPNAYSAVNKVPGFDSRGRVRNAIPELNTDLTREVGPSQRVWVVATWQDTPLIAADRAHTGDFLVSEGFHVGGDWQLHQIRVTLYERPRPGNFFINPGQNQ